MEFFLSSGQTIEASKCRLLPTDKKPGEWAHRPACYRCGGHGGSEAWAYTGWTCYLCGGTGKGDTKVEKVYTAEQFAKLQARRAKTEATREAKRAAAQAAADAEAAARRVAFEAEHGALLDDALRADRALTAMFGKSSHDEYSEPQQSVTASIVEGARRKAMLTDRQIEVLRATIVRHAEKLKQQREAEATSRWAGKVNERIKNLPVTVERIVFHKEGGTYGRYGLEPSFWIFALKTNDGAVIIYKGSKNLGEPGTQFLLSGTVVECGEFRGIKQTTVKNIRIAIPEEA